MLRSESSRETNPSPALNGHDDGSLCAHRVLGNGHPAAARWARGVERERFRVLPEGSLEDSMGPSRHVARILQQVMQVADSSLTALIHGETGTGKELVARAIHAHSRRRGGPFVAVDCGAIPDSLIESELFGYEKGAFTGADQRKIGYFQLADRGTLFLDEIVNLPFATQAKLLRALQERVIQPLGGRHPVAVDVRIVATSNVPLEQEVHAGRFRQDLYYRLNEFGISVPALRDRSEDCLYLANRFLIEACAEFARPVRGISDDAAQVLLRYHWPGNVRQLRSVIRQAALVSRDAIGSEHLLGLTAEAVPMRETEPGSVPTGRSLKAIATAAAADAERRAINQALQTAKGNKSAVARLLEIDYKTLLQKLKRYGICGQAFETHSSQI